jgi:hypothetical protein
MLKKKEGEHMKQRGESLEHPCLIHTVDKRLVCFFNLAYPNNILISIYSDVIKHNFFMLSSQADNNASEDVENDDDSYVNEAFLEDTDSRSMNMMPCQLSLSKHAGKSMMMQSGTGIDEECGATCGYIEPQKGSTSYFYVLPL